MANGSGVEGPRTFLQLFVDYITPAILPSLILYGNYGSGVEGPRTFWKSFVNYITPAILPSLILYGNCIWGRNRVAVVRTIEVTT